MQEFKARFRNILLKRIKKKKKESIMENTIERNNLHNHSTQQKPNEGKYITYNKELIQGKAIQG